MTRLFLVDGKTSRPAEPSSLPESALRERTHLQEWVIANPAVLGDDVLVVTSEYDRWAVEVGDGTARDRLDVLGLDPVGRLVVVELKRGSATRDVHLQAITYTALVSRFTLETLADAHAEFLTRRGTVTTRDEARERLLQHVEDGFDPEVLKVPRQVLIASSFPPQVTSTVVWLSHMKIDISLVEVSLWKVGDQLVADFSTVYPTRAEEEITLGPEQRVADEAGKRIEQRTRNRNVVHVLVDAAVPAPNSRLRIVPAHGTTAGIREQINAWLDADADRRWVTWTGDRSKAVRWGGDERAYSPTGLADHLFEEVTGRAASGIQGTVWFVLDDEQCPDDVDQELWAGLQGKTLVEVAQAVGPTSSKQADMIDRLLAADELIDGQELTVVVPQVRLLDVPTIRTWLSQDPRRAHVQWRRDRDTPLTWSYDEQPWGAKDLVREIVRLSTGVATEKVWWPRWFTDADGRALNKVADDAR